MNPWNARARALMSMAASLSKVNRISDLQLFRQFCLYQPGQWLDLDSLQLPVAFPHFTGRPVLELLRHAHGRDDFFRRLITEHGICLRDLWAQRAEAPNPATAPRACLAPNRRRSSLLISRSRLLWPVGSRPRAATRGAGIPSGTGIMCITLVRASCPRRPFNIRQGL